MMFTDSATRENQDRVAYVAPKLTCYGSIRDLTAGGSLGIAEPTSTQGVGYGVLSRQR